MFSKTSTKASIESLRELEANWDSYGGHEISEVSIAAAIKLVDGMPDNLSSPSIVPLGDGGVQIEWHVNKRDVEITIDYDGQISVYFSDPSMGEHEYADGVCVEHGEVMEVDDVLLELYGGLKIK